MPVTDYTINDAQMIKLGVLGFVGTHDERFMQWLGAFGTVGTIGDRIIQAGIANGLIGYTQNEILQRVYNSLNDDPDPYMSLSDSARLYYNTTA